MAALELGNYLVRAPDGEMRVKSIIRDDIAQARLRGDRTGELALKLVLREFVLQHPRCDERCRARMHLPERRLDGDQPLQPRPA